MESRVVRLGGDQSITVEHEPDECAFCEAARHTNGSGIIFFEDGPCARRCVVETVFGLRAVVCSRVTRNEAFEEIGKLS
jgi:hypothetical protein